MRDSGPPGGGKGGDGFQPVLDRNARRQLKREKQRAVEQAWREKEVEENRLPFPQPEGYEPKEYELLLRSLDTTFINIFDKFDPFPNAKSVSKSQGGFSTDNIGMNYGYPDGSYQERRDIIAEHERYQKGYFYFYPLKQY